MLAIGCIVALFLPALSDFLRPALPMLVSLVLALGMARIDLESTVRSALRPRRMLFLVGVSLAFMPMTAICYNLIGHLLPEPYRFVLVYLAATPPIASSAGFCLLLGFNARLAVEVTVSATLLTPLLGPLTVAFFLPETAALEPMALALSLGRMILGGVVLAVLIRRFVGPERISAQALVFDGVGALVMLVFVIPLFAGVSGLLVADPLHGLVMLAFATIMNLGVNFAVRGAFLRFAAAEDAGAAGVLMGNRTIAIYLAALPFEPNFALFVALYQFPMYFTPLAMQHLRRVPGM
ncbi:hypothetical protein [Algicella marina]|uniref:Bile acid:sodium symporter n=1 Tax=Algicella marina TaxID=2683284 RepID=A0A6P1SZX1_9RHOB|nr:hypothetical protein [Algicella marina]QHQ35307.1 hypothetical protein GO499_08900 [Algicella marina]